MDDVISSVKHNQNKLIEFNENKTVGFACVNLSRLNRQTVMTLGEKYDIERINPNNIIVSTSCTYIEDDKLFKGSGKLIFSCHQRQWTWSKKYHQ